jgi:hypothetical protein
MHIWILSNLERKRISRDLPDCQLVDREWLKAHGFTRPRIDYALRAGNLEAVAHGIYRKPGPPLKWEHVLYSLNAMGWGGHVGGRSAFELQGKAQFLPISGVKWIALHGGGPGPVWLESLKGVFRFQVRNKTLFKKLPADVLETKLFGTYDWPIPYSTAELALIEILGDCQGEADFQFVEPFFEGALTLRADRVQVLLEACTQVKAKRLFLWFAKRHKHAWADKIDKSLISLGSGKREIVKGGVLDPEYLITVPREMARGQEQSLF